VNGAPEGTAVEPVPPDRLTELYRDRRDAMVRLAHLLTGSNAAAQDLVHDAFIKVGARLEAVDNPGGYLRRAVINECHMWLRHDGVVRRHARSEREPVSLPPELDEMWDALASLPDRQRVALVCRYYEDLPIDEIADVLDCPSGTVKSLIHRGLAALREVIHDAE
jgi:RNA polymerase sigma factor (sigma-70 family)